MIGRFITWLNIRPALGLDEEERQNLTTFSMMGGTIALTGAIGLMVWLLRYSWPEVVAIENAALLMGFLFKIICGLMAIQTIQIIAQAVIAIGGKMSAEFAGAKFAAEVESKKIEIEGEVQKEQIRVDAADSPPPQ